MLILMISNFSLIANAEDSINDKMQVKCYIEFADGSQGVRFWHLMPMRLKSVEALVLGTVSVNNKGIPQKISRVFQCIQRDNVFIDVKAIKIEKSQVG